MRERRLLFVGDSWVAGVGDPSGLGWVGRAVHAAYSAGVPLTAYNLGVRSETSVEIAERWRSEALPRLAPRGDNRAVFSFGADDTELQSGRTRVPPGESAQALGACLATAQAMGIAAFVVGPGPVGDGKRLERIQRLAHAFRHVCAEFDVPFVRVDHRLVHSTRWVVETATGDGVHPADGGYAELARLVCQAGFTYWLRTGIPLPAVPREDRV